MKLLNEKVSKAASRVVTNLEKEGGIGGVIALDSKGNGKLFIGECQDLKSLQWHFH